MLKEAIISTIGCCVLVVNAILSFLPYFDPHLKLPIGVLYVETGLSVVSCTLFLIGSSFSFLEAVRWSRETWYGNDTESGLKRDDIHVKVRRDLDIEKAQDIMPESYQATAAASWILLPTTQEMCHLGVAACLIFLCSSAVYCACSIASLITVLIDGQIARWIRYPQLVGGIGFAVASILLMLKAQKNWWRPALDRLSWHVNFWNLIGSAGFTICSGFGLMQNLYWAQFQFGCSYLWGSCTFLIASALHWYKAKHKMNHRLPDNMLKEWEG